MSDNVLTIPDGTVDIAAEEYKGRTEFTAVVIPNGVKAIGDRAFEGCTAMTQIELPDMLENIGFRLFDGCTSLKDVTINRDNPFYRMEKGILYTHNYRELVQCLGDRGRPV